jgi:hypothetical protein
MLPWRIVTLCAVAALAFSTVQAGSISESAIVPDKTPAIQSMPGGQTAVSGALTDPTGSLTNDPPTREPAARGPSQGANTVSPSAGDDATGRIAPSLVR